MKNSGSGRLHRYKKFIAVLFLSVMVLGVFSISTALGASGGGAKAGLPRTGFA